MVIGFQDGAMEATEKWGGYTGWVSGWALQMSSRKRPWKFGGCSFMYFIGTGLLQISYILYMVQNSKSRKMYQMKNLSPIQIPQLPSTPLSKRKSETKQQKKFSLLLLCVLSEYKWIEKQVYLLFFPFSLCTIHTVLQLDFSLKNTSWRSFHITC